MFETIEGIEYSVSSLCNLNCSYCFFPEHGKSHELVEHNFDDLEKMLLMTPLSEFLWINLAGGEMSALNDKIKYGIKKIRKLERKQDIKISFKLTTNGTNLEKVLAWIDEGLLGASGTKISWDGTTGATTSRGSQNSLFDDHFFNNKIKLLGKSKWNKSIIVRYAITPDTIDNLYQSLLFLLEAGCRKFEYYFLFNSNEYTNLDFQEKFERQLELAGREYLKRHLLPDERFIFLNWERLLFANHILVPGNQAVQRLSGCSVMGKVLYVDFDGKLYPCSKYLDDKDTKHEYVIGNLKDGINKNLVQMVEDKINSQLNRTMDCNYLHCIQCSGDNIGRLINAYAPLCDSCVLRGIELKVYNRLIKPDIIKKEKEVISRKYASISRQPFFIKELK